MRCLATFASSVCAAGLIASGPAVSAQSGDLQQTVDRFYPVERLAAATPAERQSCSQVLSTTGAGSPDAVIAGYTDRTNGIVRVLRRTSAGSFEVAFDSPDAWLLRGTRCAVRLQDLDADGRPEALVNFQGVRAASGWVFGWDGRALTNLTPTESDDDGRVTSWLLSPGIYDLAHEGPLRIIATREVGTLAPGQRPRLPAFVYRPGPDGLAVEKSVLAVMGFRADVAPAGNVRSFRLVQDSFPPYTLRVINGDRSGQKRVTSASIRINEVEVLGPSQVNETTQFASTVLSSLFVENHVTATVTGAPDAQILVLVEDSTRR
jgi:hypothetical protein